MVDLPRPTSSSSSSSRPCHRPSHKGPMDRCEDILSCISALDEVIAEFDDPVSLTPLPSSPVPANKLSHVSPPQALPQLVKSLQEQQNCTTTPHLSQPLLTDTQTQQNGNAKPKFSRLITTLSTHPQEPSVTIMQKESQTVTKIQIGSGQVSNCNKTSPSSASCINSTSVASSSYVTSSPTSVSTTVAAASGAVSVVSWKNPQLNVSPPSLPSNKNSISSVPNQQHHYSKRQQVQPQPPPIKPQVVVQLKQSDFTPSPPLTTFKGSPTSTLVENQTFPFPSDDDPRAVFKNSFTNYELIFPKSPIPSSRHSKTGPSAAVKRFPADIIINHHHYNNNKVNTKNNNDSIVSEFVGAAGASQVNGGGSSYPKIKPRQDVNTFNGMESQSQSVKIRQSSNSPTAASHLYKPIPASFANNNILTVDGKDRTFQNEDSLKEHWNFLSDDNLPRSLRKTRKVILDEDEEGNIVKPTAEINANANNVNAIVPHANQNQINICTAAVRKMDPVENVPLEQDQGAHATHAVTVAVAAPVRNQRKQKLNLNASESESKKLRQQQQVLKKGIDQQSPHHYPNKNLNQSQQADVASANKNRSGAHVNNKNTYSKESGHSNSRKTILTNFMFFPLTGTSSPEDELACEQVEAAINKINNNVQPMPTPSPPQGGNVKSQNISKPTKNNHIGVSSATPRGPNALPANVAQLDVDDGYLSMINRHDPPIIWPETYIESETFTPEELKRLSSMKQQQQQQQKQKHVNGRDRELRPNKLMSSLTTSEEKTDYFSDDSLENEQVDEAENLHLSYVIATHEMDMNGHRKQNNVKVSSGEKPHYELENVRNVWRKSSSSSSESPSTPSSPVKKPLAFFIPLAVSEPSKEKETCAKANTNGDVVAVSSTKEQQATTSQVKAANQEPDPLVVAPVVNAILENVLRVGVQEASAINFLLSSAAPDYDDDDPNTSKGMKGQMESDLMTANSIASSEEMLLIEPPILPPSDTSTSLGNGSSNDIFNSNQDFPVRTSQYEADIEDDDEVPVREVSPTKDTDRMKKKRKSKTVVKNHDNEEWNHSEMEFVEDFDQPPPFIPAPPPVKAAQTVPKNNDSVIVVRSKDPDEGHLTEQIKPKRNSSPLPSSVHMTSLKDSTKHPYKNGVDQRNKLVISKSHHRGIDPDADYRMKMQRQASRSHENLLDIRSRQLDFLTPRRSQGQACTLPPNTAPPLNQRRHSTFRQFLGGIFKRSKKSDTNYSGDVPDSPFEDIQFSFGRKNNFPVIPETTPNGSHHHELQYNERKLSFTNSPHGSQRSTRSTPVKRGLLSRIFHRKEK